jgi:hypothetical protein
VKSPEVNSTQAEAFTEYQTVDAQTLLIAENILRFALANFKNGRSYRRVFEEAMTGIILPDREQRIIFDVFIKRARDLRRTKGV